MKNKPSFIALFFSLVIADQFLKFSFSGNSICNKNIAWSIPTAPGFFYFFWLIIFFALAYYFLKSKRHSEKLALVFILSGAVSNMIDRATHGCVIDFIDLKIWPIFNLADVYITMGVIILITIKILNSKH